MFFLTFQSIDLPDCMVDSEREENGPKWQNRAWSYIIWSSLMIHMCRMKMFQGTFFILFKILSFWIIRGVKIKIWPKMTHDSVSHSLYLDIVNYMIVIFGTHEWWWNLQQFFSFFQNFEFFLFFIGKRITNDLTLPISVCHALYLRNCRSYDWDFWYRGVK